MCERELVTKFVLKDCVCEQVACDKVVREQAVCEIECVTKL